ncbi:MAG TPA: sugar ABC transporter substrate-binding protein [Anaerovoracaceae bacterium]|nr:sugar ABC transporter substrate-binding protein [Anaerovoracaceae bacterium]
MKKHVVLMVAVLMVFALAACSSAPPEERETADPGTAAETDAGIKIGVSFGQNVHPFFVAMQKGIEAACADYGINADNYKFLAADSVLETQVTQIENLVTMGCDVILLNPYDSDGVKNAVAAAIEKGVAVITIDIDCEGSTAFVASNNVEVGKMLGEYIVEKLGGKGKIAMISGISVTSLKDRTEGFKAAIEGTDIELVAEQQTAMQRDTSLQSAETILQANPDIDAFIGVNENSGMAILSAVTGAGLPDIIITTVDATAENMVAIRDGKVAVGVSQDPYQMGYIAVEQAIKSSKGEQIDEFTEVPISYMTQDNVQEYIEREEGYGVEVE